MQTKNSISGYRVMADLGSGTGILSIVAKEIGNFKGKIHAFDSQSSCV